VCRLLKRAFNALSAHARLCRLKEQERANEEQNAVTSTVGGKFL